ncbi:VOC family protein [Brevundimonas sp.]|jgi:catechol 2,3-dioxygenase-like lactoylglutathione lyase family enzyme|uniref:VOC family protein n=1 Tax=Brevundimonas sp. TaxID=1871086 RepID=UPI002E0EC0B0|nr:VOC family protein [Brevundimonas sp.]
MIFVSDVEASADFYTQGLGFTEAWSFRDDAGKKFVSQVDRDETEIILSSQWPDRVGKGMLFIELVAEDWKALPAALKAGGVPFREGWWGYRSLIVTDPDGNELYFPDPNDQGGDR